MNWIAFEPLPQPKSIADFARFRHLHLTVTQHAERRWTAHFDNVEIKDGPILEAAYGDGMSPYAAVLDYSRKIAGKLLVINAGSSKKRCEFTAWQTMTADI